MADSQIINMTSHEVVLVDDGGGTIRTFPASGMTIRVSQTTYIDELIDGIIPVVKSNYGQLVDAPTKRPGVYYIVSNVTKNNSPGRDDFLVPAQLVRDRRGRPIACRSFSR